MRTIAVDSIAPSVFAQRLLLAWDYSFLDDGERANRRSRSVMMNRGMAEDVLRTEDLSEMLARDAVARVAGEATGTAPGRQARDADELYELIRAHGALNDEEIGERCARERRGTDSRIGRRRAHRDDAAGASAGAGLDRRRGRGAVSRGVSGCALERSRRPSRNGNDVDHDAAREEMVRRALRTSGPVKPDQIAERLGFDITEVLRHLAALEAKGAVFRGRFSQRR